MRRAALPIVALVAACGPGSYRAFRDQLVDASCEWGLRCGVVAPHDRSGCPVDDLLTTFHDSLNDHVRAGAIDVAASIDAGRMRYDSVNADACLDAVRHAPCEPTLAQRKIGLHCNAVVAPHTETDRACWGDGECTGGICALVPGCAGICANYASYGDPCVDSTTAPAAMQCDPTVAYCGEPSPGANTICLQKKPEGADCAGTRECRFNWTCRLGVCTEPVTLGEYAACGGTEPCDEDLYCDPGSMLCQKRVRQGDTCDDFLACEDGLACIGLVLDAGAVAVMGTCAPWLTPGAACNGAYTVSGCPTAAPCTEDTCVHVETRPGRDEDCSMRACAAYLACNLNKRCDFPSLVFGDCGGDRAPLCAPGLVCATRTDGGAAAFTDPGTCVPMDATACFQPAPGA